MDYVKKFVTKDQWKRALYELAHDFCIPKQKIDEIIMVTVKENDTNDQEILYRKAHKKFFALIV